MPVGRRERVRAATVDEIKAVALRLLVEEGQEAATLRAIAREMGMTAPGLYRYFPSHEDLHKALVADTYDRITAVLAQARDGAEAAQATEPMLAAKPLVVVQLVCVAKAFRDWAAAHPQEFRLVFGSPVPALAQDAEDPALAAGNRFGALFTEIFLRLWAEYPFPVDPDDALPEALAVQLRDYRAVLVELFGEGAAALPLGAIDVYLRAWVQLYGLVAMDVFNHLHFCLSDAGPFFETSLAAIGRSLGIVYVPEK
ncbi:MAG: TetR/AcrR family transcriptional regulator [Actinobacteria bacterium]|nr:TetR/AcrR family transcriptional regulator [Actinomycetota bacterium]